ncbi:MAG: response regulator [Pseudomonadota bacterium]
MPEPEPEPEPEPRRLSVLAAEDNKTNQLVFRKMIKTLDLDLRLVWDGAEAIEAYQAERPDVIFTDISMPGVDGLQAAQAIRQLEQEAGLEPIPMVAMTAHASEEEQDRIKEAGIDHYLSKPLKKTLLLEMIRKVAPEDVSLD